MPRLIRIKLYGLCYPICSIEKCFIFFHQQKWTCVSLGLCLSGKSSVYDLLYRTMELLRYVPQKMSISYKSNCENVLYFKNLLIYPQAWIKITKYTVIMSQGGSTKIVKFMTLGARIVMLGCGHMSPTVKMLNFIKIIFCTAEQIRACSEFQDLQGRCCCVRVWSYTWVFFPYFIKWFYSFPMHRTDKLDFDEQRICGPVDMQIWYFLIRNQCSVSLTQVTIKAFGPLVKFNGHKSAKRKFIDILRALQSF